MIGESAHTSIRWFGVDGPATSVKYESHRVKERAQAQYLGMSASRNCTRGAVLARVSHAGWR